MGNQPRRAASGWHFATGPRQWRVNRRSCRLRPTSHLARWRCRRGPAARRRSGQSLSAFRPRRARRARRCGGRTALKVIRTPRSRGAQWIAWRAVNNRRTPLTSASARRECPSREMANERRTIGDLRGEAVLTAANAKRGIAGRPADAPRPRERCYTQRSGSQKDSDGSAITLAERT